MKTLAISILMVCLFSSCLVAVHFYLLDGLDGWFYSMAYEEDTLFSEGYSDSAFRRVYRGMPEAELHALLSTPLGETWIYCNGSMRIGSVGFSGSTVDHVHVPERSQALGAVKTGIKKEDVILILGEPQKKSFAYSRSRHDQSYRIRTVVVARGTVLEKRALFYVD